MPEEFSRTTARKRITLPGGATVDVPVITLISFIDPFNQYQEWQYSIDNSAAGLRKVHVDRVPSGSGTDDLEVERIDKWTVVDPFDRAQETEVEFDNLTGGDTVPPRFITHLTTHVVRYKNPDDDSAWIESELIDSFAVIDPYEQHQEKIFTLLNPADDDAAQANPDDPEISDTANGIDPPWRTDPFQNIVNWSDNPWLALGFTFGTGLTGRHSAEGPFGLVSAGDSTYCFAYTDGAATSRSPSAASGILTFGGKTYNYSGAPFTNLTISFDPWKVCADVDLALAHVSQRYLQRLGTTASKYHDYPTPGADQGDFYDALSVDISVCVWSGHGPHQVYFTNPDITNPGMITDATLANIDSEYPTLPDVSPFAVNYSVFVFGDRRTMGTCDFSALSIVGDTSNPVSYSPVAISIGSTVTLKDGSTKITGATGGMTVLCRRDETAT